MTELKQRDIEMVLLEKPKPGRQPIQEVIFNEKLSREFQSQYEYRFGTTAAEQSINSVSRDENFESTGQNLTIKEYRSKQQKFGEYMSRRLTEYHVDNWAKSDPSVRPIYQAKEKISHVQVNTKHYKFKWSYSLSGNTMDFAVENPYKIDTQLRLQMAPGSIGPTKPEETIYTLGYQATQNIYLQSIYKEFDGVFQLIGTRPINSYLGVSLTGSFDHRAQGETVQQDMVLVGLTWHD